MWNVAQLAGRGDRGADLASAGRTEASSRSPGALEQGAEGYRAMDERRAIETLLVPNEEVTP